MTKPVVGVTAWRGEFPTYAGPQILNTLETQYSDAVVESGMIPLIIPNGQSPDAASRIVKAVDGLLLTGGTDINPEMYGEGRERVEGDDIGVDRFEVALVREARAQGKPLLAICRGLQLINVALGGSLRQDVGRPGSAHEPIEAGFDPDEAEQRRHAVHLEEDALLADLFGSRELKVNTLHHQGVDRLAEELIVEGRAPDGLVEAARYKGSWWALGVQWHPERLHSEERNPLFEGLEEAIRRTP